MRVVRFLSLCMVALVSAASFARAHTAVFNITSIQSSTGSLGSTGVGCVNAALWFQRWLNETKAGVVYSPAANVNYTLRITHANDHSNATLNALLTAAAVAGAAADGSPAPNLLIGPHSSLAIASSSICEAARTLNFQLAGPNYIYEAGKQYLYGTAASSYRYTELFIKTMSLSQPSVASVAIVWNSGAPFTVTTCQQAQSYAQTATRPLNVSLFAPYATQARV
jgi:hypothetical protein